MDPKLFTNIATAVGTITDAGIREFTSSTTGQLVVYYRATLQAGASKVVVDVWGTRKQPLLPRQCNERFALGDLVIAQGALTEQVSAEGRVYRSIRAWRFEAAGPSAEAKAVFHAAGRLGHVEVEEGERLVPIAIERRWTGQDGEVVQESMLRLSLEPATVEALYRKAKAGTIIRVRGDIIAEMQRDRYEVVTGFRQALQVAEVEIFDPTQELWMRLADGTVTGRTTITKPPSPAVVAASAARATEATEADIPF